MLCLWGRGDEKAVSVSLVLIGAAFSFSLQSSAFSLNT
jgi:hypothetical protein